MSIYAKYVQGEPLMVDYTPAGATSGTAGGPVLAGDVLVINGAVRIAHRTSTLAADGTTYNQMAVAIGLGVYDGLKSGTGSVNFADGDPVFWSAGSALFTATNTDTFAGYAIGIHANASSTVRFVHCIPGTLYSGNIAASGTFTAGGNATFGGTVGVTGDVTINTNRFTVTAASGNTLVAGTLTVAGASAFTGAAAFGAYVTRKTTATPVAAAGTDLATAAALSASDVVAVSSDGATKGVKLLTGVAGQVKRIINTTTTACRLFPASGGTLNGLSADVAVVLPASKVVEAVCTALDTWTVVDLTKSASV